MAKQSGYLRRRQAEQKRLYDVGMDVARQVRSETASDLLKMMVIALNDDSGWATNGCGVWPTGCTK